MKATILKPTKRARHQETDRHFFKTEEEASAAKVQDIERLWANADWDTFKWPVASKPQSGKVND
jgi:hypothetical protein